MKLKVWALGLALLGFVPSLSAQGKLDPEILKELQVVHKDGKDVFLVSLRSILKLAAQRAPQLEVIQNSVSAARGNSEAALEMEPIQWTNKVTQSRSVSNYSFPTGGSSATYLTLLGTNQEVVSSGLKQKTKLGISYGLTYQKTTSLPQLATIASAGEAVGTYTDLVDKVQADALIAEVNIPLFQDFGEVNEVVGQKAEIAYQTTFWQGKKQREQLLGQVASVYWDLVLVHENLVALQHALDLAQSFHKENLTRFELGALDPTEVKLSETQLVLAKKNLFSEQVRKKEIEDQIRLVLGLTELVVEYEPTEKLEPKPVAKDPAAMLEKALAADADLALLKEQIRANRLDLISAQNGTATNLDLNLQYQLNSFSLAQSPSRSGFSDPGLAGYQVGLTWSVPLFDRRPQEKLGQAQLEQESLRLEYQNAKDQLELALTKTLRNLELAKQSIDLSRQGQELNRQLLEKERLRFKLGQTTTYRVGQVQQDLLNAELSFTAAKVAYEKTYLALLFLTDEFDSTYGL
ncbi:MAG: hypothetical protein A2600_01755 [Candidatus Lambdaproteobacteria bacterium RIFOXYD1_FULL_56_27]|uniref:Transporter n=1 Tax=Candidatus Lambdaproteobacteria bacterium RIFOXYD2_FULL_56_26 TaxID=1817773 RepID=A0A1F6GMV4_9PROT|nr:MAG: hypothetical protein A2557_12675 [Candidatus Lambdaproteobacteria bacterium RIFOXYD2_FULL_56_26]OGH05570.1 MAG: hypothetical protein A2426_04545 [Candidatus Lambdaproteobacteria bacterium RIFOXYC1_FULL_56_13]OGH08529.1 MAG: hypothetical protein A2600_01755 [Candidatus Lambdaproteobacteria bacterium RIFOXYD1_FULL_56_27]